MRVSDVMKKRVYMVSEDTPLTKAISIMERYNFKEIPVMRGQFLLGKISFFDVMGDVKIQRNEKVGKFVKSSPVVQSREKLENVIKLMKNSGTEFVVVCDKTIVGVLSDYDIIKSMKGFFAGMGVQEILKRNVGFLSPEDSIASAKNMMERQRVDRLPVVREGVYLGQVVWADILRSMDTVEKPSKAGETITTTKKPVSDILRTGGIVTINDKLDKAISIMLNEHLRGLPVLDVDGNVEGLIFRRDLLSLLVQEKSDIDISVSGKISEKDRTIMASEAVKKLQKFKEVNQVRIRVKQIHGRNRYEINVFIPRKKKAISVKKTGKLNLAFSEAIGDIVRILSSD
jgi:CBS domain-containing protein